jgi:hypothetical protein
MRLTAAGSPIPGSCRLTGIVEDATTELTGMCRAMLVVTRTVSADMTYHANEDAFRGTYASADNDPAVIAGRRSGNVIGFNMYWPKDVDGDQEARLYVENDGAGTMRIIVYDRADGMGEEVVVLDLVLSRICETPQPTFSERPACAIMEGG